MRQNLEIPFIICRLANFSYFKENKIIETSSRNLGL